MIHTTQETAREAALRSALAAIGNALPPLTDAEIARNQRHAAHEARRYAYVLKGAPEGSLICRECDGYGNFAVSNDPTDDRFARCDCSEGLGYGEGE